MSNCRGMRLLVCAQLLSTTLGLGACAGFSGGSIDPGKVKAGDNVGGIPYYEQSPFLLVTPDLQGGYTTEVVYLPDPTKLRYVEPWQFLASSKVDLTFKNGSLETSKSTVSALEVPKALISAAVGIAKAQVTGGASIADEGSGQQESKRRTAITPYLFKIDLDHTPARLIGSGGYEIQVPAKVKTRPATQSSAPAKAGESK